jgi:purine-binding chemotaxis protein CheW
MENIRPGQFLSFALGNLSYGISISSVREINRVGEITPIPETPSYIAGVINLRGNVIPVLDLRTRLGLVATPYSRRSCIIVVDSQRGPAGLLVDSIFGVMDLGAEQIEPKPAIGTDWALGSVIGMGKVEERVLILVEVERILMNHPFDSLHPAA